MLSKDKQMKIINKIVANVNPAFIILFGSCAEGSLRENSDVDIAYFSEINLTAYETFTLAGELARLIKRDVDLIDLRKSDTVFAMQIFSKGIPIYMQDENEFIRQRMRAYSMYATLNEQRAPILKAIRKRGSVFGDE